MGKHKMQKFARDQMFERHPFCHWCNVQLVHPSGFLKRGETQPANMATIDHLVSRLDERRRYREPGEKRWVLACTKCNGERCTAEQKALPIDSLRRRSGRYPKNERPQND